MHKSNLENSPDKISVFLTNVKFLCQIITISESKTLQNKIECFQQMKPPKSKLDVMKILGTLSYFHDTFPKCMLLKLHLTTYCTRMFFCKATKHKEIVFFFTVLQTITQYLGIYTFNCKTFFFHFARMSCKFLTGSAVFKPLVKMKAEKFEKNCSIVTDSEQNKCNCSRFIN